MAQTTSFTLNGKAVQVATDPDRMLAWVLRHNLGLTGTKVGCGAGLCGACTVLVDDEPTFSCSTALADVAGKSVLTIEGLARNGVLHPIQRAFQEHHAFQCGYCTPGMILNAYALLKKKPGATRAEILEHLEGNLCRCGSHLRIVAAVQAAGKEMGGAL
ncbi:MAG: (2Fe-2S)-binding protein [Holophaga sp.]|nr:(2Fe-2S)-binding protein [Holophaga sp.]